MFYRLHTNALIVGLLTIGYMAVMVAARSFCIMTIGCVLAFTSQLLLLLLLSQEKHVVYTDKGIFWTTLIYSFVCGFMFMSISYYYDGDTFMLSKTDANVYYTESMMSAEIGLEKNVLRIINTYNFEDCGALVFDSIIMSIIPHKLFLNTVFMFMGALSSVMLYRIGLHYMDESSAYIGALGYATSSYLIFFHCSFLKESLFVFLVICAMYFFYRVIADDKSVSYFGVGVSIVLIMFFRPAVGAFLIMSFLSYYAILKRKGAVALFLYGIIGVIFVISLTVMQGMVDKYTGGDMDSLVDYTTADGYSSGFSYFVCFFASLFGPFPTLFPKEENHPILLNFYAAGQAYKVFLIIPFWLGVYLAIKRGVIQLIPLITFILIEMLSTAFVMASLELRKVLLHLPFMYILSSYCISHWHSEQLFKRVPEKMFYVLAVGILVLWNIIRKS